MYLVILNDLHPRLSLWLNFFTKNLAKFFLKVRCYWNQSWTWSYTSPISFIISHIHTNYIHWCYNYSSIIYALQDIKTFELLSYLSAEAKWAQPTIPFDTTKLWNIFTINFKHLCNIILIHTLTHILVAHIIHNICNICNII